MKNTLSLNLFLSLFVLAFVVTSCNKDDSTDPELTETCSDGIQNQNETGIDCGGDCDPCATCSDGIQNQNETGIDCGGECDPCPTAAPDYFFTCKIGISNFNGNYTGPNTGFSSDIASDLKLITSWAGIASPKLITIDFNVPFTVGTTYSWTDELFAQNPDEATFDYSSFDGSTPDFRAVEDEGSITITLIDTDNRYAEGTFEGMIFNINDLSDVREVTEGSFRLPY